MGDIVLGLAKLQMLRSRFAGPQSDQLATSHEKVNSLKAVLDPLHHTQAFSGSQDCYQMPAPLPFRGAEQCKHRQAKCEVIRPGPAFSGRNLHGRMKTRPTENTQTIYNCVNMGAVVRLPSQVCVETTSKEVVWSPKGVVLHLKNLNQQTSLPSQLCPETIVKVWPDNTVPLYTYNWAFT